MLLQAISAKINMEAVFVILAAVWIFKRMVTGGQIKLKKALGSGFYILLVIVLGILSGMLAWLINIGKGGGTITVWTILEAPGNGFINGAAASMIYQTGKLIDPTSTDTVLFKENETPKP